ncbi:hypothetical protein ANTRET_LOCUS5112 [Anthophora retusa]
MIRAAHRCPCLPTARNRSSEKKKGRKERNFHVCRISFDLTPASRKACFSIAFSYWPQRVSVARDSTVAPHSSHAPCLGTLA